MAMIQESEGDVPQPRALGHLIHIAYIFVYIYIYVLFFTFPILTHGIDLQHLQNYIIHVSKVFTIVFEANIYRIIFG